MNLPNTPIKGTSDRFPSEFNIRKYIFDTRRKTCKQFGYEEYLAPLVENAEIYRAKSGEDVGGSELTLISDRDGNLTDIAIRPEMTPSVTRMITRNYTQTPKPIRYFSIANYYRNEKPQRGRNREFRQLNIDLFGNESTNADIEILQIAIEIMLAFDCPQDSWILNLNHRKLIEYILDEVVKLDSEKQTQIVRLMDKREKLSEENFNKTLIEKGLDEKQTENIIKFMQSTNIEQLQENFKGIENNIGFIQIQKITNLLTDLGYAKYLNYSSSLIRGFDYYDGMVFEVFDKHPDNNRAMFGGGRYNGLANLFGSEEIPAVGFAPGDESMKLFLESRNMIENIQKKTKEELYYIPMIDEELSTEYRQLGEKLRKEGKNVINGLEPRKISKAFQLAEKKNCTHVVILGQTEKYDSIYKIKKLETGDEQFLSL